MPCINRIRVNNVKYNFGTQQYDDFSMRMYGRNTLYDLANGGGKSVLMLLLLQNLIPNCTLDEKQPVEKLFRTGGGNTTIHSLIEWKLDEAEIKDGYRYMTTGFCARRRKDAEEQPETDGQTASIEYFNYCIFYREYNKNDIINLPLSNGTERMTYSGLKSYLKELGQRDMSIEIRIFERKGEYQRFISEYGLHESHWELIRGINKTEGHVRTYFETNYRTTRKVVEDLLIEEIIEKAFRTRTGRDGEDDKMAETLLEIKDKLNLLAQKKRDIANYDHQAELISVLSAKVSSCISRYEAHADVTGQLADIYATAKALSEKDDRKSEDLLAAKTSAAERVRRQSIRLENLKIMRDGYRLQEQKEQEELLRTEYEANEQRIEELRRTLHMKESVNDYLGYLEDKKQMEENRRIISHIRAHIGADQEKMQLYAYNRKLRDEKRLTELLQAKHAVEATREDAVREADVCEKQIRECEIALAVAGDNRKLAAEKLRTFGSRISELTAQAGLLVVTDAGRELAELTAREEALRQACGERAGKLRTAEEALYEARTKHMIAEREQAELEKECERRSLDAEEYRCASKKLANIMAVYQVGKLEELEHAIRDRIEGTMTDRILRNQTTEDYRKKRNALESGRLFQPSKGAQTVIDYITTRHGSLAMHGADYLAALAPEKRAELLRTNKALAYGVIVKKFADLAEDEHLSELSTGGEMLMIYDMERLSERAIMLSDSGCMVCRKASNFTDEQALAREKEDVNGKLREMEDEDRVLMEKIETYREDLAFVRRLTDEEHRNAADEEQRIRQSLLHKKDELREFSDQASERSGEIRKLREEEETASKQLREMADMRALLLQLQELSGLSGEEERRHAEYTEQETRLTEKLQTLRTESVHRSAAVEETDTRLQTIAEEIRRIQEMWEKHFRAYDQEDGAFSEIDLPDEQLEAEFLAMEAVAKQNAPGIEDKEKLVQALSQSMERILHTIKKRGIAIEDLAAQPQLDRASETQLSRLSDERMRLELVSASLSEKISHADKACGRLEGSIEYAVGNLKKTYGEDACMEEDVSPADAETAVLQGDRLLSELSAACEKAEAEYEKACGEQKDRMELYKDVKRIVETQEIPTERGRILEEDISKLRQSFESGLLAFDRSRKQLEKTRNELMRFKGQTAEALSEMGVYEMAETIRRDVAIPETYQEAKTLLDHLLQITDYINLEKERVEKGIEDMVAIKENFCSQCLQRCMDVKTELEKLPKLSRITVDGEEIRMVDLKIPYVKEEFLSERMSAYIDDVVKGADAYGDERKRIRYIRELLTLKRLFGVMVTDMNAIRLKLYKRERIREQSRYLRYEEAVGSTGQSQGIYIQFLVAIINYIAGMYEYGKEGAVSTKTIFIDNPFGAAKDVYIWEPIFAMLAANHVQLIVPARGATPAITGRFDVNYVLGQQMVGGRQQTVVVDYTSRTREEELEYRDISYQQATFEFI